MFGNEEKNVNYFSVTFAVKIGSVRYIPQVCYRMTEDIRSTVVDMEVRGLAKIYQEEGRFVSGIYMPIKKPEPVVAKPQENIAVPKLDEIINPDKKRTKVGKPEFD
jgi:hypothetical protein